MTPNDKKVLRSSKSKKKNDEDAGTISDEDFKVTEPARHKSTASQVLTPIGDPNFGLTDQQVQQNLLKAEYTVVVLRSELQKKKNATWKC